MSHETPKKETTATIRTFPRHSMYKKWKSKLYIKDGSKKELSRLFRLAIILILLIISGYFLYLGTIPLDKSGTTESKLVKTNGNNLCTSCMGLYK